MNCSLKLALVWIISMAGCASRAHIAETHGQSYSAAFGQQTPHLEKVTGPVRGLDSQEAAIISSAYRRSLAPKAANVKEEEPILLVAPPSQQAGGYGMKLAPSVPSEK